MEKIPDTSLGNAEGKVKEIIQQKFEAHGYTVKPIKDGFKISIETKGYMDKILDILLSKLLNNFCDYIETENPIKEELDDMYQVLFLIFKSYEYNLSPEEMTSALISMRPDLIDYFLMWEINETQNGTILKGVRI